MRGVTVLVVNHSYSRIVENNPSYGEKDEKMA